MASVFSPVCCSGFQFPSRESQPIHGIRSIELSLGTICFYIIWTQNTVFAQAITAVDIGMVIF